MKFTREEFLAVMNDDRYPLSKKYDPDWLVENHLGSHCLWLTESLVREMDLKPGMRILDMGCGKALGSIFLAKEFGVQVWANDLWISATDNWKRICTAGVDSLVYPIHAEAHSLPYADGFFDAVVSINALQFFATGEYYITNHLAKLVKPGGQFGIVVPGIYREFEGDVPDYLTKLWSPEFYSWHSPEWWRRHWSRTGLVDVELSDTFLDGEGYRIFETWEKIVGNTENNLVQTDGGRNITFVRMVARKK